MACRYTYKGKTYEAWEFEDVLTAMSPAEASVFMPSVKSIPDAPFIKSTDTVLALSLKRIMKMAVDGGYDRVAFVNGEQSAERFSLDKHLSLIEFAKAGPDNYRVKAYDINDGVVSNMPREMSSKQLEDHLGKEIAERIVKAERGSLEGDGLKVEAQGMRGFYDKIVPAAVKDVLKKVGGGQMEAVTLPKMPGGKTINRNGVDIKTLGDIQQPGFTITDAMREKVAGGLPLFNRQPVDADLFRRMTAPMQRGMPPAELQKTIAPVLKRWENGPSVTVVPTTAELPMGAPRDVHGVYVAGRVYLVAANIRDRDQALRVLGHEAIAHHGLREMLGKDDWKKFMANIQLALKTGNKPLNAIRKDVREAYVDDAGRFNLNETQEADEIAAKVVEQAVDADGNFRPGFGFVKSVYAKIAEFLRSIGIDVKMTMAELQGALVNAQRFLETGSRTSGTKKTAKPVFARAYHGTPHRFERFTTDAIGTGEGAQAYGYGLYFASRREIAEHYRRGLSERVLKNKDGEKVDVREDHSWIARLLDENDGNYEAAKEKMIEHGRLYPWPAEVATRVLNEWQRDGLSIVKSGQLYEVEIPADSEMLLWDKPLSEQPEKVREALKQIAGTMPGRWETGAMGERRFVEQGRKIMLALDSGAVTGEQLYRSLGEQQAASEMLLSAGIKGIKYLDGGSRDKGDGSYNYVVFSDDDVSIVDAAYSREDQTQTPAFKRWFGDSKVVNADGKPLVVYHGTRADFTEFSRDFAGDGMSGEARDGFFFTSDPAEASDYAGGTEPGGRVMPVYVALKRPTVLEFAEHGISDVIEDDAAVAAMLRKSQSVLARLKGIDGLMLKDIGGVKGKHLVVAFRPEQIKSAIGNNGNFDPQNPDIRFSRTAAIPPAGAPPVTGQAQMFQPAFWDVPQPSSIDTALYELQDKAVDLKRVQEAIGKAIPEKFDARLKETLYPGRVAVRTERFLKDEAKPLLEAMARNNVTMDELADYLHARHAEERNKQIAKVNPDLPDGGAGKNSKGVLMTTEAAKAHIAGLSEAKRMALAAMAKRVDAITAGTRTLLVNEGLEKQETLDAWTGAYKHYVPLFRDEAENGNPHPTGAGMSVRGSASKRAAGSTKKATNILAHVLMQREAAITRAEKNRVATALYGLALSNPNPDFWTTIRPNMSPEAIGQELQRMGIDPTVAVAGMGGVPTIKTVDPVLGRVISRPNPLYKSLDGAIVLRVNGEDRVLMINTQDPRGKRMAENLKNLDGLTRMDTAEGVVGAAVRGVHATTRWLASVNTQYNPAFGVANLVRDTVGGAINLSSTPLRGKTLKVLALTPAALKGIGLELSGARSGEWGRYFRQFQEDGGQTGFRDAFKNANERARLIERELKAMEKAGTLTPAKAAGAMLSGLDIFNTMMENAVRLAAYREALLEGMTRPEAARLARELTVDFNRRGRLGRELGPFYAFFNASVQGSARTLRTLAGPAGAKIIASGVALGVLQALMLLAFGYEDDEIPEFVKARALIIPLGKNEDGEKRHLTIPLPLGLHVLPNTGRVLTELTLDGGRDAGAKAFAAVGEIAGAFNPLGGGNIFTADGALRTVAPTVADPIIESLANKNFAGTPIERERFENDPRPGFERAREATLRTATGQAYTEISRIINTVTGGNQYEAGLASPTPEMLRYWAQVFGGGLLREVEKTINTSVALAKGEDTKPTGYPVLGRFYGVTDDESTQRTRFYENVRAIEKAEKMVKAAEKAGDIDAARAMDEKMPENRLGREKNRATRDVRDLNREAMQTVGDPDTIKRLDEARANVMRGLNEAARQADAPRRENTPGEKLKRNLGLADVTP